MSTDDIQLRIAQLKAEIARLDDSDAENRQALTDMADMMEARLQQDIRDDEDSPFDSVRELIRTYEARYPQVTVMVNDIMTRLASMGI